MTEIISRDPQLENLLEDVPTAARQVEMPFAIVDGKPHD